MPKKPATKTPRVRVSPKQKKLAMLIAKNLSAKKPKSHLDLMIEAGYSEQTARSSQRTVYGVGVQAELQDTIDIVRNVKRRALERITDAKLEQSSARDLSNVAVTMEKIDLSDNIRRKSGEENKSIAISIDL
jgi:hypothetical protein